jgi:predicted phage-related endonuclease
MNYINHDTFIQDRINYIGASDIPILCPELVHNNSITPLELYYEKRGEQEREITPELQQLFDAGHEQENITLYNFLKTHDPDLADKARLKHLQKKNLSKKGNIHIFTEFIDGVMMAHPDLIWNNTNVEMKFIKHKGDEWNFYYKKVGDKYGGADDIPFKYFLQCQFQMMLTGCKETILCANYHGAEHYYFRFKAMKEFFYPLKNKAITFMQRVKEGTPVLPETLSDAKKLWPKKNKKAITLPNDSDEEKEFLLMVQMQKDRKKTLKKRIKNYEAEIDKMNATVSALLIDNNVLYAPDGTQLAKVSEYSYPKVKSLSELKKTDIKKYNRFMKYVEKNEMLKMVDVSKLNF